MFAGEIAAKHGDLQQVGGERGPLDAWSRSGRVDLVERSDLGEGENAVGRGVWLGTRRHSDEEYAPTDHRDEATNLASLSAVSSLASSARQPDSMTLWNTSAYQRRAYQPSFSAAAERSSDLRPASGHQLPVDRLATGRRIYSRAWM